eukprot:scpid41324/ scgid18681/ Iron/zinc purple acid phosphatase-like protein
MAGSRELPAGRRAVSLGVLVALAFNSVLADELSRHLAAEPEGDATVETVDPPQAEPGQQEQQEECEPEQVHLALARTDPYVELTVQWATGSRCVKSATLFGTDPAAGLNITVEAHTWRHAEGNELGRQWLHRSRIVPEVEKQCFYQVCSSHACSKTFWTNTQKLLSGQDGSPLKFLFFGDLGLASGRATIARLHQAAQTGEYVAMFHVGDIAYDLHDEGGRRGDRFLREMEGAAAYLPYMTAPGNHELFHQFHPYMNRFSMPVPAPDAVEFVGVPEGEVPAGDAASCWPRPMTRVATQYEPLFYSMDIGLVHVIAYDTESLFMRPYLRSTTRQWLQRDLAAANRRRKQVPWIVAFGHRPMYCSNLADNGCNHMKPNVRVEFEKIFFDGGVDLILEGHEHSYERFYPTYNRTLYQTDYRNPRAPVHIITGQTGCSETFLHLCTNPILRSGYDWSAYRSWLPGLNGYGRLTVMNHTHLVWEQVLDHFFQVTLDQIVIEQNHHGAFTDKLNEQ